MKSGIRVKNFFEVESKNKGALKQKRILLATLKFVKPLHSWPKDKERLLYLINNYLSMCELEKLGSIMRLKKDDEPESVDDPKVDETKSEENKSEESTSDVDAKDESSENANSEEVSAEGESEEEKSADDSETKKEDQDEEQVQESDDEDDVFVAEDEYIELPDQLYQCENCSAKVLGNIIRILNYRSKAIRKIRLMRRAGLDNERINLEIEKVAVYNIVLAKFLPILNKQEIIDKVNLKTATKLFEEVCVEGYQEIPTQSNIETEIKKNKEDQDFDIVAALIMLV